MLKIIVPWLLAFRLKTIPAAISPVLVGTALALDNNQIIQWTIFISILISSILIQIGTNLSNDLSDFINGADTNKRLGPIRAAQSGLISVEKLKSAMILSFGLSMCFGLYLVAVGGYIIVIIGLLSIISGYLYTSGPYPLGYNGLGDIFVFVFFGLVAVMGTFYLHTSYINLESLICGMIIGSLSTAILVVNNIRDINTDLKSGKNTLAVIFGLKFSKLEFSILILLPYFLIIYLYFLINNISIFLAFFTLPIAFILVYEIYNKTGVELNDVLAKTARLLLIFSFIFSFSLIT
jgi:1,4-dihydroxy-2-naphthoate octaprenyltransferase